ncbi:MAG: hypothetical protein GTO63_22895, partial [Anaerolineae bacterium]|nr:hypothetical protein [Anaerolineae bacterium]
MRATVLTRLKARDQEGRYWLGRIGDLVEPDATIHLIGTLAAAEQGLVAEDDYFAIPGESRRVPDFDHVIVDV